MSRIFSKSSDDSTPTIDRKSIEAFFSQRAAKADQLGHVQAVIYQDKHPDLAKQRDAAEKAKLLPLLQLKGDETVLDMGCGTGRWADVIVGKCGAYVGTDFSEELIGIARERFASIPNARFICLPAEQVSLSSVAVSVQVILSLGLFIYLNDEELAQTIRGYASVAHTSSKVLIREPIGTEMRLTIKEHFSEEMGQVYNAIYRTERELMAVIEAELMSQGFRLVDSGDVYESALNNRAETRQKWYLLER